MADEATNRGAFRIQEHYCRHMAAPIYGEICATLADALTRDSRTGARVLGWPGEPTRDALPLRLVGGLHALVLAEADAGLARVFAGEMSRDALAAELARVLVEHDAALLPWLDGPPQTNEPGRSAALLVGLLEVARRNTPRVELLEIGSSAGLNLLIDRFGFDLGGTRFGPSHAPIVITPEWQGAPPTPQPLEIVTVAGCDVHPLDATDPTVAERLRAYVWAETPERMARLDGAVAMLRTRGVDLVEADAADWLETRLTRPQPAGVTRVLMHSVVWQYLSEPSVARIRAAMAAAAAAASQARPLAWVTMEPDRATARQMVRVRSWPHDRGWHTVATAHSHGTWVRPGPPAAAAAIPMPDAAHVRPG